MDGYSYEVWEKTENGFTTGITIPVGPGNMVEMTYQTAAALLGTANFRHTRNETKA